MIGDSDNLLDDCLELTLLHQRGEATDEQAARLERLLLDHPEAVAVYLGVSADTVALLELIQQRRPTAGGSSRRAGGWAKLGAGSPPMRAFWGVVGAAAACLVLFVGGALLPGAAPGWFGAARSGDAGQESVSMTVVGLSGVDWDEGQKPLKEWDRLRVGDRVAFGSGVVQMYISNGVALAVEGPADFRFASASSVLCERGKVAARVGPDAIGFRVETPHAAVIDRGTSFGVTIDSRSGTDVVVYEGAVDLDLHSRDTKQANDGFRRLNVGEALSIDPVGAINRITTVENTKFLAPPLAPTTSASNESAIVAVRDSLPSQETSKYYRVMPGGFREDCPAYVDRQHEWNGVDAGGLPPFMVGGDYVMTFNDDKIQTDFEIAIQVDRPVTLYVILDDRVDPPAWLTRDFVDTHWDVGADEAYEGRDIQLAVGAGRSVDHVCSVWRREVDETSTVLLGAISAEESTRPARDVERSMYGIVVTPSRMSINLPTHETNPRELDSDR